MRHGDLDLVADARRHPLNKMRHGTTVDAGGRGITADTDCLHLASLPSSQQIAAFNIVQGQRHLENATVGPAMGNVEYRFSDRIVALTGGATGIGRATAEAFGQAGATTYVLDIDENEGRSAAGQIERATFVYCDVTAAESVEEAFSQIEAAHGRVDVVVNNAGGFWVQRATQDLPLEEWQRVMDLNLNAVFLVARRAVALLRQSCAGRIINIGSLAGQVASYRTSPAYAAAKAGVHSLTRVLATELADDGITVNAIAPSVVMTERIAQVRGVEERESTARSVPLGRYQEPSELAAWILFLASDEAGFATGQTFAVNGGRHMT